MSNSELVRHFFRAHADGRLEDMLALVHPSVLWRPSTELRRTFYSGHDGTLALFHDMRSAMGPFAVHVETAVDVEVQRVHVVGWLDLDGVRGQDFETWIYLKDGRLLGQVSEEP